jgi:hypothetical protein
MKVNDETRQGQRPFRNISCFRWIEARIYHPRSNDVGTGVQVRLKSGDAFPPRISDSK